MSEKSTRDKILDSVFKEVYAKGYNGTSTAMILKDCNIPKGSLYHYFPSKKEMVLAVIRERMKPKIKNFFHFEVTKKSAIETIIATLKDISNNSMLISYGCPLNRLNQEMSSIDIDFEKELNSLYEEIRDSFKSLLDRAIKNGEISNIDTNSLAEFIIASVWGAISLSPQNSSKDRFLQTIEHLISYINILKKC